jgi:transposase
MPMAPAELPTDVAELQAMVLAQAAELAAARAGVMAQRYEIEQLKARLARLLRQTYGVSSEKLRGQIEQLELRLADIEEQLGERMVHE